MQNFSKPQLDSFQLIELEKKLKEKSITTEEINLIKEDAEAGCPRAMFVMAKYYLENNNEPEAFKWFNALYKKANGYLLFETSNYLASYDDLYADEAIKFLRHAAWRQHPIAKLMYAFMKENPFKFPDA